MVKIEDNQVYSTEGKYIRRIGTGIYFKRGTTLLSDNKDDYEEVDEILPYTKEEYDAKVAELIHERYSPDEETSLINNMLEVNPTEEHVGEYRAYQAYRAECKAQAKLALSNK